MLITKLHTPEGVKDYLPEECEFKNNIQNKIADTFAKCGFKPISAPTIEYAEVFSNTGGIDSTRMYNFVDRDGTLLTLRPDVTPSIARIVATAHDNFPKKLYYVDNTFRRNESYQGKLREFTQAGIEIINGNDTLSADAEAIVIAIRALKAVGLESFKIDIGHAMFLNGVIEEANISDDIINDIQDSILHKNYVAVAEIADKLENDNIKLILKDLPLLIGDYEILQSAKQRITNAKSIEAIDYLSQLYEIIKELGLEKYISFDLSVIGAMDYYTGIIFRGYTRGTGFSILDGGRYDNMVATFGKSMPAVGFAIKINDLINVADIKHSHKPYILIAYDKANISSAFKYAQDMRDNDYIVEISDIINSVDDNIKYAEEIKASVLCYFGKDVDIIDISKDETSKMIINKCNK